jgi:serine phosphatase RsbU (regulator of sigma subunit)
VLGARADPNLVDTTVHLHRADSLLLYTDGLTDAYAPRHTLAPADIESLLRSCIGRSADETAEHVSRAVLDLSRSGPQPRDDIALVVLRIVNHDSREDA